MPVSHPDSFRWSYEDKVLGADYDEQADVLYLWLGESAREGVALTSKEGHLVRLDPTTYEIVGFTIFDFTRRWQQPDPKTVVPITVTVPSLGLKHKTTESKTLELVPA